VGAGVSGYLGAGEAPIREFGVGIENALSLLVPKYLAVVRNIKSYFCPQHQSNRM
jgi:hypothetical protein